MAHSLHSDGNRPQTWRSPSVIGAFAAVFLLTLVAYWPVLHAGFIWDDDGHITPQSLRTAGGLWRIWTELGATQQYYPVLHSLFWFEHHLWGDAASWYHAANIAWHALASCLLIVLVRRLKLPGAALAGLLFALHPVAVESVAWITEQKNTVSTVFCFAAAIVYLRYLEAPRRSLYLCASALFALALASKSVTAILPAALLVIIWWQRGTLSFRRNVGPLVPWFMLGAAAGVLTMLVEREYIGAQGFDFALSLGERCLLAARVIWFYLGKLAWPVNLSFVYERWTVDARAWWQWLLLAATFGVVAFLWKIGRARPDSRAPLAVFLLFAGTLFPVLGFLNVYPFKFSYVADHFQYLARAAVIVAFSAALTSFARRRAADPILGLPVVAWPLLAGCAALTWYQCHEYQDNEILFRATLARNPNSWLAHLQYGVELDKKPGRLAEAIAHYEQSLRLRPANPEAYTNLGVALAQIPGQQAQALAHLHEALRIKPDYPEAHINLANQLLNTPQGLGEAISHYRDAVRIRPNAAVTHYNLANALSKLPDAHSEALLHYAKAVSLAPEFLEARYNFAAELAATPGRASEAIAQFEAVLRLRPDLFDAHYQVANLYLATNNLPAAIQHLEIALKLKPGHREAQSKLAQLQNRLP